MIGKLTKADVREIFAILDGSDFDELHIETEELKLTVRRNGVSSQAPAAADPVASGTPATRAAAEAVKIETPKPVNLVSSNLVNVPAPMLGIFHSAPKPGADPFVKPGTKIAPDTVVGIIEVMKLMNPVTAGLSGVVVETVVPDGTMVEFGQTILRLRSE
ncbi:acetyl-CoA carboxylase biotin carboxyl carrier protein [Rhizobium leguminosarum]